jgi:Fe-S-cluster containining protein
MSTPVAVLPPLYARWMDSLLGGPIPGERHATCDACAMCRPAAEPPGRDGYYFDPGTKCCTYTPILPNFLAGRILADGDPAMAGGRASVLGRIKAGVAVTPLGVGKLPGYATLYDKGEDTFGRSAALRCPHYVETTGNCGIWRHREAVCSTWFCKHVRGQVGQAFWRDALLPLLRAVEDALAKWCVLELDIGTDAIDKLAADPAWKGQPAALTAAALDLRADEAASGQIWGTWLGRELEFYQLCGERVEGLGWDDALALTGVEGRVLAPRSRRAFDRLMSETLPGSFTVGELNIASMGVETSRVVTYSASDPLDVSNMVLGLLPFFDGRPTESVLADIAERTGVTVEIDLVRKLADFNVLKPNTP